MLEMCDADELGMLLLQLAAASARDPARRALTGRWLRAALELVDAEAARSRQLATEALADLSKTAWRAVELAEFLAEITVTPLSPP